MSFVLKYLSELYYILETNLEYDPVDQVGTYEEKMLVYLWGLFYVLQYVPLFHTNHVALSLLKLLFRQ
jgi:hypothetical protein